MMNLFEKVIERFRRECLDSGYELILEADVCGWLFHIFLNQPETDLKEIHLNTRVDKSNEKIDLAIGRTQWGVNGRPYIQPNLVTEIKLFPRIGFTGPQHRAHYEEILNRDLPKLGQLDSVIDFRAALIVDGKEYLNGTYKKCRRLDYLIEKRNQIAPGVHIFIMTLSDGCWNIQHIP